MSNLNILIIGASIAGPATAYWLAKAGAKSITIIERFPSPRTGGQAVDIRGAGVSVMRKMGEMESFVKAKSTTEEGVGFVRDDGTPYGVIRMSGDPERQSIVGEFEILRGDLAEVLDGLMRAEGGEKVECVFGEEVESMDNREGGVRVEFKNGKLPTGDYDLVVACDGAMSRTRAMGMECGVRNHVVPSGSWAAYFSIKSDLLRGSKISIGVSAVGGRFVSVGPDASGLNRVMLMGIHPNVDDSALTAFREALSQGQDQVKNFITRHFRDAGWRTNHILQEMMDSTDFYASEIVQIKAPVFHTNRLVLVGDAGYAAGTAGGGTSLALTGAYMLAGEISKHPSDLAAGLKGYEDRMRPIIDEMHKIPPLVPWIMAPQTAWGIWIRNQVFGLIAWTGVAELVQKYLGPWFEGGEAFVLPEYDWT